MADKTGTDGDEDLLGTSTSDRLWPLAGNDRLYGNNGDDELWGGDGNDLSDAGRRLLAHHVGGAIDAVGIVARPAVHRIGVASPSPDASD